MVPMAYPVLIGDSTLNPRPIYLSNTAVDSRGLSVLSPI